MTNAQGYSQVPLGISPARALGPAPAQLQPFTTPNAADSHTTPTNTSFGYKPMGMSSSSASSSTDHSSSVERPTTRDNMVETSEDENDSPTKRVDRIPTFDSQAESRAAGKKPIPLPTRGRPPPSKESARNVKFGKAAVDPGVEGVPPGPRSDERPSQSFACIIGQAILKSSAGGLSLEHIYRYVETAYPYFKTVEQWRNSVRHNLSIHKIFVTIPRSERHPPGKGGIWIIDDVEKIHWPSEDKFIKNFPPSHPHHAVCRQTCHERAQEKKLREKAEAEGRPYVPKNRKRSKMLKAGGEGLGRPRDIPTPPAFTKPEDSTSVSLPGTSVPGPLQSARMLPPPPPTSPPAGSSSFDFEDDSDFVPMESEKEAPLRPLQFPESSKVKREGLPPPPRFEIESKGQQPHDDEENVFSSGPKRVRMSQPEPLSPILEQQASTEQADADAFLDADMFTTPARERTTRASTGTADSHQMPSSMLKTPALVQTSSSPTSSPMPPTVTRASHHHPSSLQQAWTHDDMIQTATPTSPAKLEAAFDLKPTPFKRERDEEVHSLMPHGSERAPPKTPVTRSSAAADRTPRISGGPIRTPGMFTKTPLTYGSPARAPPSTNALLSTPMWEMNSILDRMTAESPTRTPRSDVPPTSPTHYSLSDCGDSPIAKRRKVLT